MGTQKVICDTDVMIDYWDESQLRHHATKNILESIIGLDNVVITSITKMELMIGAGNKTEMNRIVKKLNRFKIALPKDEATFRAFELIETYRLSHGLSLTDGMIAAMAIEAGLELFTYNVRDFKFISGLRLLAV